MRPHAAPRMARGRGAAPLRARLCGWCYCYTGPNGLCGWCYCYTGPNGLCGWCYCYTGPNGLCGWSAARPVASFLTHGFDRANRATRPCHAHQSGRRLPDRLPDRLSDQPFVGFVRIVCMER